MGIADGVGVINVEEGKLPVAGPLERVAADRSNATNSKSTGGFKFLGKTCRICSKVGIVCVGRAGLSVCPIFPKTRVETQR